MSENKEIQYIKCYTCGRFIVAEDAYKNKYCSLICSSVYDKCRNCGSFYVEKKGFSESYCSKECFEGAEQAAEEIKAPKKATRRNLLK